jgi:putative transposase
MTETLDAMDQTKIDHQELAQRLLAQAKADGVELVGPNGLLNQLTANVLEVEMDEHLGYEKHHGEGREGGDSRNGRRAKTVLTETVPVQIQVPRETDTSFDPQIVKKRQRRWRGVEEIVLSLSAKGLTTGRSRPMSTTCTAHRCPRTPSAASPTRRSPTWPNGPGDHGTR